MYAVHFRKSCRFLLFLNIHYLIASALLLVLYVIFSSYTIVKKQCNGALSNQENSKQRFIKREK